MKAAIPKIERRIADLNAIEVSTIQARREPRLIALEQKIEDTLIEIFGCNTLEYSRYGNSDLDTAGHYIDQNTPLSEVQDGYRVGIAHTVSTLQTIIDLFREKLQDLGETADGRAIRAFGSLEIHPEIDRAVAKLFRDGHYANAVEDACKVLDGLVKVRSGRCDLTGTPLMQTVFSAKAPILRFNELKTDTDQSEQQGMMFLYAGAMSALRNPRAHELIKDDAENALEYIGFLSLLAKSLDRATKV